MSGLDESRASSMSRSLPMGSWISGDAIGDLHLWPRRMHERGKRERLPASLFLSLSFSLSARRGDGNPVAPRIPTGEQDEDACGAYRVLPEMKKRALFSP